MLDPDPALCVISILERIAKVAVGGTLHDGLGSDQRNAGVVAFAESAVAPA